METDCTSDMAVTEEKIRISLCLPRQTKNLRGTVLFDRTVLDVRNWVDDHTRNLLWNGRARMSCGFNNWRHMILGGADAGTTLS